MRKDSGDQLFFNVRKKYKLSKQNSSLRSPRCPKVNEELKNDFNQKVDCDDPNPQVDRLKGENNYISTGVSLFSGCTLQEMKTSQK